MSATTLYLHNTNICEANINLLANDKAFTTRALEETVNRGPRHLKFSQTDSTTMKITKISLVVFAIIVGLTFTVLFGAKIGVLATLISAIPLRNEFLKIQAIEKWRKDVECEGAKLAKIYESMTHFFIQRRKDREKYVASNMEAGASLNEIREFSRISHWKFIELAEKIKALKDQNIWVQYTPHVTRPTIALSEYHKTMLHCELSDWQELQYACQTYLQPASVCPSRAGIHPDDYLLRSSDGPVSFIDGRKPQ
jgi:hypothetical protein